MKRIFIFLPAFFLLFQGNISSQWVQTSGPNKPVWCLAVNGNNIFAGTGLSGVLRSTNNGLNWTQTLLNNQDVWTIAVSNPDIFAGTDTNGVYHSTDNGDTWIHTSLSNIWVYSLAISGSNVFAGTNFSSGVYRSTNLGLNWVQTSLNNQMVYSVAANGSNVLAGTDWSGVYLSTNSGQTWTLTSLTNQNVRALLINGSTIFAGTMSGFFYSTNMGQNWTQTLNHWVLSIAISGTNVFVGSGWSGFFLSTNNGLNWSEKNEGILANQSVMAVVVSGNYVLAGQNNYVYRRPLPAPNTPTLISPPNGLTGLSLSPHLRWTDYSTSVSYRVQLSTDSTFNNIVLDTNVAYTPSEDSLIVPAGKLNNNTKYYWHVNATDLATSQWSSTWHFTTGPVDVKRITNKIPEYYKLYQNYPNPFNPTTKIKFNLPLPSQGGAMNVNLKIFDILGHEVATLVNKQLQPGSYEVEWNASNYTSGIYFYKLTLVDFNQTKRMVLIK